MADYGADGMRGSLPSWATHMSSRLGQTQLRAFEERIQARLRMDVSAASSSIQHGVQRLDSVVLYEVLRTAACLLSSHLYNHALRFKL